MPQIKSQKKRVKTNDKRHQAVVAQKSALKTAIKKVLAGFEKGDDTPGKDISAAAAYREASSKLDKAVVKGLHHRNYAIRQKSRLSKAVNSIA